jgi:phospholipid/cholesterol/gamma-HCH transport system substrate-binding protein
VISRTVRIQLVVFILLSFFGVVYTGFTYVGIRSIGPIHFEKGPYTIRMELTDSGGIYTRAPVTYRGVQVGLVGTLRLDPAENPNGVEVDLEIDHGTNIPIDTTAQVANLSAVGEQYVNLVPQTDDGPYFRKDDKTKGVETATYTIPTSRTAIPISDAVLLKNLDLLASSVNKANLHTVLTELAAATNGVGPDLQTLIDSGDALLASAQQALPQTLTLINDGKTVLNTQADVAGEFQSFAHSLNLLSQQLVTSDPDLRSLLDNGVLSAQTLNSLLQDNEKTLPTFFSNLVTLGQLQQVRLPGLQTILVLYPLLAADTPSALDSTDGSGLADAQFAATTTMSAPACNLPATDGSEGTSGYQSTTPRVENPNNPKFTNNSPTNKNPQKTGFGGPANLNTLCTAPNATSNTTYGASSGTSDYRGAGTVPRPAGDTTGKPGGSVGTSTDPNTPNYYFTPYSATSGDFVANGTSYQVGTAGQEAPLFGGNALSWLLTTGASG